MGLHQHEEETKKYRTPVGQTLIIGVCALLTFVDTERTDITDVVVSEREHCSWKHADGTCTRIERTERFFSTVLLKDNL